MTTEHDLELTDQEGDMLDGKQGHAVQRAIEIVVALAKIYGARRLVPVTSVQVAGVSFKNLGEAGLEFLREWAGQGARVRVPTTLNPAGIDLDQWQKLGFSPDFAERQQQVIDAYTAMGIKPTCTCTPYWIGNRPRYGEHIAWAESSAVSFANSVLGARTNREGGPSALAAAICGRTAAYGLHLDENRQAHYRVDVHCPLLTTSDWSALGYLVGRQVQNGIPCFYLSDSPTPGVSALADDPIADRLKALGAAMAASGAVALYHIAGLTPEARGYRTPGRKSVLAPDAMQIVVDDLSPGYAALQSGYRTSCDRRSPRDASKASRNDNADTDHPAAQVDLVSIGCPHASRDEIRQIAQAVNDRRLRAALWITTARETKEQMAAEVEIILAAGGQVVADTCLVVAPIEHLGFRTMATNSAKMAAYSPSHSRLQVRFGTLAQCIEAAATGRWPVDSPPKAAIIRQP
jgi:predicted aconitase